VIEKNKIFHTLLGLQNTKELEMEVEIFDEIGSNLEIIPLQSNNQNYEDAITIHETESGGIVDAESAKLYNVIFNFNDFIITLVPTIIDSFSSVLDGGKIAKIVFKILEAIAKHSKVKIEPNQANVILALAILTLEHQKVTNDMVIEYLDSSEPQEILDSLDILISIKSVARSQEGFLNLAEKINLLFLDSEKEKE